MGTDVETRGPRALALDCIGTFWECGYVDNSAINGFLGGCLCPANQRACSWSARTHRCWYHRRGKRGDAIVGWPPAPAECSIVDGLSNMQMGRAREWAAQNLAHGQTVRLSVACMLFAARHGSLLCRAGRRKAQSPICTAGCTRGSRERMVVIRWAQAEEDANTRRN
jgi:hypothetical protein